MDSIRVGLVADPAAPTEIARRSTDLSPRDGDDTAVTRLQEHTEKRNFDVTVGLTELPLHDHDGRHLLVETDPEMIGLVTRSPLTRLAAAWVEALICVLAGLLWFLEVVWGDRRGGGEMLAGLGAVVLLVPLVVTGVSTRYLMRSTDAGRA